MDTCTEQKNKYELHLKVGLVVEAESVEKALSKAKEKMEWDFDECTYCNLFASEEIKEEDY